MAWTGSKGLIASPSPSPNPNHSPNPSSSPSPSLYPSRDPKPDPNPIPNSDPKGWLATEAAQDLIEAVTAVVAGYVERIAHHAGVDVGRPADLLDEDEWELPLDPDKLHVWASVHQVRAGQARQRGASSRSGRVALEQHSPPSKAPAGWEHAPAPRAHGRGGERRLLLAGAPRRGPPLLLRPTRQHPAFRARGASTAPTSPTPPPPLRPSASSSGGAAASPRTLCTRARRAQPPHPPPH